MPFVLHLTHAGEAAVQGIGGSDPTVIASLGLTATPFDNAPTLDALPGEFKRIPVASGIAAAPNIAHLTAYDTSDDVWSATGFGLFLEDGTLFAAYSQDTPALNKAGLAFALLAFDIAFSHDISATIAFGDATFVWPPATESIRGIARIATQAQVDAQADDATFVTPLKLGVRLTALTTIISGAIGTVVESVSAVVDALGNYALKAVTITGAGLVSGGGDLSENRTLTVTECSAADIAAGTEATKVITPRRLGPVTMLLEQNGFIRLFGFQIVWGRFLAVANTSTAVDFVQPFVTACFSAVCSGGSAGGADSQDNPPATIASTITPTGFSVFSADDTSNATCFIAVGS